MTQKVHSHRKKGSFYQNTQTMNDKDSLELVSDIQLLSLIKSDLQYHLNPAQCIRLANSLEKQGRVRDAKLLLSVGLIQNPQNKQIRNAYEVIHQKINGRFIHVDFHQTERPKKVPSVSLVMIVKNEEKDLPRCLSSFQDIVQEIIVVDTGSTDHTVEIARSFGARVEFFPWCDDFAAARNESLKYAACDWILRTDADEYIEEQEKPKLLQAIASGTASIFLGVTHSRHLDGKEEIVENVRLIKNHLGLHYENPIHETITPSAVELGLTQVKTNIHFIHTGYLLEMEGFEKKLQRNLIICEKGLMKDPDNFYLKIINGVSLYEQSSGTKHR